MHKSDSAPANLIIPPERSQFNTRNVLIILFLLAIVLRLAVTLHAPNVYRPDEIFQNTEPAHRLAFGPSVITWEWRLGIRSWVFPVFLAGVMRATYWMGAGSSGYLLGIAVVMTLISLATVWFGFAWAERASGRTAAIIAGFASATWWEFVYMGPKTFSEVLAAHLLLPGRYLGAWTGEKGWKRRLFLAGLFCGLAVSLRVQLGPAVGVAAIYFCRSDWRRRVPVVAAGLLLPILGFGLVDAITWTHPFQSFYLYFWVNLIEGKSNSFGVEPWYWYLGRLVKHLGPLLLFACIGIRRSPFLGWIALTILVSHSFISHKEIRFLYPMMAIVTTLAALGMVDCANMLRGRWKIVLSRQLVAGLGMALCLITSVLLGLEFPDWSHFSGTLIAFKYLSHDSAVCGVGITDPLWAATGGYTYLHRNVPILLLPNDASVGEASGSMNAIVNSGPLGNIPPAFKLRSCWKGVCLYKRPGPCSAAGGYEINQTLANTQR
jgi:phosphatidylinositol glycan class B